MGKQQRKKILHVLNTNSYSGAENVAMTIINNLSERFDMVYVSPDGPIREILEKNKITFFPIDKLNRNQLTKVIKTVHPQLIHAHDFRASVCAASCNYRGIIISHIHQNPTWISKLHPFTILYALESKRFKKIISISKVMEKEFLFAPIISQKFTVIPNVIDSYKLIHLSQETNNKNYDIIFLGRLTDVKDPLRFIRLIHKVAEVNSNIRAAMIGDGDLYESCKNLIDKLKLHENIILKGFMDNPYSLLANSKMMVMTSKNEGLPLAALEALALGTPVIATAVGGLVNAIDPKIGMLYSRDDEAILEILKVATDTEYRQRKSENAKEKIRSEYRLESYVEKMNQVYQSFFN